MKSNKAAKKEIKKAKQSNEEFEIAVDIINELERFSSAESMAKLARAKDTVAKGMNGIINITADCVAKAKALPSSTKQERLIRREAVADAKLAVRSQKAMAKHYPHGIVVFSEEKLNELYALSDELTQQKAELLKGKAPKEEIEAVTREQKSTAEKIKKLTQERQNFTDSVKVYTEAKKFIAQAENYARFGELDTKYDEVLLNS